MPINKETPAAALTAILADLLALVSLFLFVPRLAERFGDPSGWNALLLGLLFTLFAIGVYLLRRLKIVPGGSEWLAPRQRGILALLFALSIMTMLAWQFGFFESLRQVNTRELGEGPTAVYYVFAPGAWLGFSLLYIIILAFHVTPTVEADGGRYTSVALIGLLATDAMLIVATAQVRAMFGANAGLLWGLFAFVWLAVLFLPPRMVYVRRAIGVGNWANAAAASLLVLIAACSVWIAFA